MLTNSDYTILIVDDDHDAVEETTDVLRASGYNVLVSDNGKDAVETAKSNQIDILLVDYFMKNTTGEELVREVRKFDTEVFIILQTAYSGEKPALKMLEEVDINGYHNKADGIEDLLCWIKAGTKSRYQLKESKRLFEQVELANRTIESVKKDQELLIEQSRLASIGDLAGVVIENMSIPLFSTSINIDNLTRKTDELLITLNDPNSSKEDCLPLADGIVESVYRVRESFTYVPELLKVLLEQTTKSSAMHYTKNQFTLSELIEKFLLLVKEPLDKYKCILRSGFEMKNMPEKVVLNGKIISLLQALLKITSNAAQKCEKPLDGKSASIDLVISEIGQNIRFSLSYIDKSGQRVSLEQMMVITRGKEGTGLGTYTAYSIITEHFGGKMWVEPSGNSMTYCMSIPFTICE